MPDVYGEMIGCDSMYTAPVTSDTLAAYVPGSNTYLAPTAEISHEAKTDMAVRYYDNKPRFTSVSEANSDVKITVSGVPCSLASTLTGKPYDSTKGVFIDTGDASDTPWRTLSGRMDLGDGGYRYFQYLKGKFSLGASKAKTKEDKLTVNTTELTYTAVVTNFEFTMPDGAKKGIKGVSADTPDPLFTMTSPETNWFAQVQTPATISPVSAIALSSSNPANNATGVATSVKPSLTFNNVIANYAGITLTKADGTVVAISVAPDSTGKILTITPSASLTSAATYYIMVAGVTDIYGQTLATQNIKFTC